MTLPSEPAKAAGQPLPVDISVVVATLHRPKRLEKLLAALEAQTYPLDRFEVVIAADRGDAQTTAELERAQARGRLRLRSVHREPDAAPAVARDHGWRAAGASVIAFTDDDCTPHPAWVATGLKAVARHPGSIVQGRTDPDPSELDRLGPFSRTIEIREPTPSFQCCNVFYPRELLERVGGFDTENFDRWGAEDADLAWRAIEAGAGTAFAGEARVFHAVNELGPLGKLRHATRWTPAMAAYARHRGLRQATFTHGLFWKETHFWLARAVLSLLLPARWIALRNWLAYPYLRSLYARGKLGGRAWLAPYFLLDDLAEVYAVVRGAVRYRRPML